jgi:hypothetical protein
MQNKFEQLIKAVYKKWKIGSLHDVSVHPDEEEIACFLEGRLPDIEAQKLKVHLTQCQACAEALAVAAKVKPGQDIQAPAWLIETVKGLIEQPAPVRLLELILRWKEKAIELIETNGAVFVGRQILPVPLLRSRKIQYFNKNVTVLKDFSDIRLEVRIESRPVQAFDLSAEIKDKRTLRPIRNARIALFKDNIELESYQCDTGKAIFEHVAAGKYLLEVSATGIKSAQVALEVKV